MNKFYVFELKEDNTPSSYDEALAAACMQGLANRNGALVYLTEPDEPHREGAPGNDVFGAKVSRPRCAPWYWLDKFSENGGWLCGVEREQVSFEKLFEITKQYIKGIVIWDTAVAPTVNVATTIAGVEDLIVMSEDLYNSFGKSTGLEVKRDLRGMFDGSVSGSVKVDAYNWALENYLEKGLCSCRIIGNFNDSWRNRDAGWITSVLERDRFVCDKAFCFDLSPWDYFAPLDEPNEPLGVEKEMMLKIFATVHRFNKGKCMTEFCGFFNARKLDVGQKCAVLSEWEQVYLMSPYNIYQNTVTNDVFNQTFHKWHQSKPLKQGKPIVNKKLENKVYVCMQVCDMDSTTPLYDTMIQLWHDPRRGELPLAWGLNPNLSEVFPDLFEYFYDTKTDNDWFCADASAAGYFNPVQITDENWPVVTEHCKHWYSHADMTISGMVLDIDNPTPKVLKEFAKFSPDGFVSLCSGWHRQGNLKIERQVFEDLPITYMTTGVCDWNGSAEKMAKELTELYFSKFNPNKAEFLYYRLCYRNPGEMFDIFYELQKQNPKLSIEMVDPYTYFDLVRQNDVATFDANYAYRDIELPL